MECVEPQLPQSPHGFCDLQLKPEPLRIANRTESASSGDTCVDDPSVPDVDVETSPAQDVPIDTSAVKDARIDEEVSQVLDQDSAAVAQETVAPPDATHSLRTTTSPRLSALMSRFETFETMVRPEPGNPILTGSPSSKLPLPRPALAPLDPNLAAAATPQNGTIGALDGHCNSSRDVKPSATPQKPPKIAQPWSSGQKASTRPAPAVQSVSERRKMFERLSGDGILAAPVVAQATAHTTRPTAVDTGLVSALRTCTPNSPRPRPSPRACGFSKPISPQSSLRLPRPRADKGHSFLGAQKEKPFQQHNNHTVADLRKAFEREPATKTPRLQSGSLPNTPKRAQTPKAETRIISPGSRVDKKPSMRRRHDARDFRPFALPSRVPVSCSASHPSRLPTPTTIRQTEGRALKADLADELSQTVRRRGPTDRGINATSQNPERIRSPTTPDQQPLLVARTISVKAYTVRPVSRSSKIPRAKFPTDPLLDSRNNDAEARRMAPRTAASRSLQHWKTRSPTKSGPSLPVIVSTTIGASTRSGLRQPSSLASAATLGPRVERPLTPARKQVRHGAEGSKHAPGVEDSGTVESSMRQRVFVLEQVGRSARGCEGCAGRRNTASPTQPAAKKAGVEATGEAVAPIEPIRPPSSKKASGWERRLSSQALRSFSANARRKLSGSKRRSRSPPGAGKSQLAVPKSTPAAAKPEAPDQLSDKARLHRNFSFRATLRRISRSYHDTETFPASPRPMSSPSAEQLAKTASIAPRPFHRIRTRSGRFLPIRNSYHGASNSKLSSEPVGNDAPASSAASWVGGGSNTPLHAPSEADPKPSMDGWTRRATVAALDISRRFRGARKSSTSAAQSKETTTPSTALAATTATATAPRLPTTPIRQGE